MDALRHPRQHSQGAWAAMVRERNATLAERPATGATIVLRDEGDVRQELGPAYIWALRDGYNSVSSDEPLVF